MRPILMEDYNAFVNGEVTDIGVISFHYQDTPFPGGMDYQIHIWNPEAVECFRQRYPVGIYQNLGSDDVSYLLGYINLLFSLKLGKARFAAGIKVWVNNIRNMEVHLGEVVVSGECSPHVSEAG